MTRASGIKKAAIPRAGYDYQDLVGIEVLIRHFRDPSLYDWVMLEAEDPEVQSLDDVIARRHNGKVDYIQVKFTVDADIHRLDWTWLLTRKGRGKSMLAKWSNAFRRAKSHGPVGSAQLRTNRKPAPEFAACLDGQFVDLVRLDGPLRTKIETECGGPQLTAAFFANFAFASALPDLARYEQELRDTLLFTETDETGWLRLLQQVRRWATHRGEPPPDGKIRREHLIQLITRNRPQQIRQDFAVPEGYSRPSAAFDELLRERVRDRAFPITVIWGGPGRGKSTYLSYLAEVMQRAGSVVIRHHYFLPTDQAGNRTSFFEIAHSLLHQLASRHPELINGAPDEPDKLRETLSEAADRLAAQGARLYLIVDGLDHVWRDTERVDQLDQLFNILLPLPDNIVLLVGTQLVPDAQLPNRLLVEAKAEDWVQIPAMDEPAVHRWLRYQDAVRPLLLAFEHSDRDAQIDAIGDALFKISAGHPLHLIYTLESLRLAGEPINSDTIQLLPSCPDGDIQAYYQRLWVGLTEAARQLLHGLAGSDFFWPAQGVRDCFGSYYEIAFLLEPRASGLTPFHPSIFAWVRERADHAATFASLLPRIVAWLDSDAPPYWRWGWLWLGKAMMGDTSDLLAGCTRDWAVTSLAQGWSDSQIRKIIAEAERHAFEGFDLAGTLRLRSMRTRLANLREFQARDFGLFRVIALAAHDNFEQVRILLDSPSELGETELAQLVKFVPEQRRAEIGMVALSELWRRTDAWIALRHKPNHDFARLSAALLSCCARSGEAAIPRALEFISRYRDPRLHYARLVEHLGEAGDIGALRQVRRRLGKAHGATRRRAQEEMLRAAWRRGGDPDQLMGRFRLLAPLVAARAALNDTFSSRRVDVPAAPSGLARRRYRGEKSDSLEGFFCDYFWVRLTAMRTSDSALAAAYADLDRAALGWIATGLDALEIAARAVADGNLPCAFSTPFIATAELAPVSFSNEREQDYLSYLTFRKSMVRLAIDLQQLGGELARSPLIPKAELETARGSLHWSDEVWLSDNTESGVRHLSGEAASDFLVDLARDLGGRVTEFSERGEQWSQLAALAHLYQIPNARTWIGRAADCLLGYGYRKDLGAMEVLEAINELHTIDPRHSEGWVCVLVPIVDEITNFTDGDETDHVRSDLIETVALTMPERLGALFAHHSGADEWRYADECLKAAVGILDFSEAEARALAHTLVDRYLLTALVDRGADSAPARELHAEQLAYLGGEPPSKMDRDFSDDSASQRKRRPSINPSRYAPQRLEALLTRLRTSDISYDQKPSLLRQWLDHWLARGRAIDALEAIEHHLEVSDSGLDVEDMLDHAFRISLLAEGKDRAYRWLVRAHIHRNGWARFWAGDAEVTARLEAAATHYPERWSDYIRDTSEQTRYRRRRGLWSTIGHQYLVRYLLLVGQIEEAVRVTDALVDILREEVRDQPIEEAKWFA